MNSRVISSPENVTATLFIFWLMSVVLLAGIAWQMVDLNSVSSPFDLMKSLGKLSFLVSVVILSFILAFSQPQKSVGILGLVFSVFSIYHFFNLGEPCGCLNRDGVSTWELIVTNFILSSLGLVYCFIGSRLRGFSSFAVWIVLFIVASTLIIWVGVNHHHQNPPKSVNFNELVGNEHPFLFPIDAVQASSEIGQWDVFVVRRSCAKCILYCETNFPRSVVQQMQTLMYPTMIVAHQQSANEWFVFGYLEPEDSGWNNLVPVKLMIRNGILQAVSEIEIEK